MEILTFIDNIMTFRGQEFTCGESYFEGDAAIINIKNDLNDCFVIFVSNHTSINGVIQTSAQMIIDTLANA